MRTCLLTLLAVLVAVPARADSPAPARPYVATSAGGACTLKVQPVQGSWTDATYTATRADGTVAFRKTRSFVRQALVSEGCQVLLRSSPGGEKDRSAFVLLGAKGEPLASLSLADLLTREELDKLGFRTVSHFDVDVQLRFDDKGGALVLGARCNLAESLPAMREAQRQRCGDLAPVERRVSLASGKLLPR